MAQITECYFYSKTNVMQSKSCKLILKLQLSSPNDYGLGLWAMVYGTHKNKLLSYKLYNTPHQVSDSYPLIPLSESETHSIRQIYSHYRVDQVELSCK